MKQLLTIVLLLCAMLCQAVEFEKYFEDKTLRIDYVHAGNAKQECYYFESLKEEPYFAGSKKSLIDTNNLGMQRLELYDVASGELIYSRGFCVLFTEWQSTPEAQQINKAYRESMVMPYPKNKARIEIHSLNKKGKFEKKFEHLVDPASPYIEKRKTSLQTFDVHYSGAPTNKVDIVFIPEGYAANEYEKFKSDCEHFGKEMFTFSPFKERANDFNIRGVWAPSEQSGISKPEENEWKNTVLEAKFYTFESERYQMVDDFQKVRDVAANAPYDLIYIISNTKKYGGGAIYNFYGISSSSHPTQTGRIFVHEFGHLFLGLADEYGDDGSMSDFYPAGVEPWEVNLTRDLSLKQKPIWRNLLDKSTPTPTEIKAENDSVVGIYEGGGYLSDGIYRPWINCMMRTLNDGGFCPVCREAISQMIDFVCE